MSVDYIDVDVCPTIPTECMEDIESWLLFRVFGTKKIDDRILFYAYWTWNDIYDRTLSPDNDLERALAASRQVCPDLCAAVEREISTNGKITLGAVDYETIFQSIIRRHPNALRHISIKECDSNSRSMDYDETFTLITATAIESIRTKRLYEDGKFKNIQIVRRSGPWKPESPYIIS